MKAVFFSLICFFVAAASCRNRQVASSIPACIYKSINKNGKDPDGMVGSVKEFEFQGKLVYAFDPDNRKMADGSTTIKDAECNTLCSIGGFGGMAVNKCNGDNFFKTAVYKRTIWEKK